MANLRVTNIEQTSARAIIENLMFHAGYYDLFEVEVWDFSNTVYSGSTFSWTDPHPTYTYTYLDIYGLDVNTGYTFKGFVRTSSGRSHVGNESFFTLSDTEEPPPDEPTRPSNWSWTTLNPSAVTYTSGKLKANLVSASEWVSFCSRINEFRSYKGISTYPFTTVTSTQDFTSAVYDEARLAISSMVSVNTPIGFYSKLVALSDALNSIS